MPTANDTTVKGHVLHHWDPENPEFWERTGARIARRNLWISIISLTLSFAIGVLWSVVTVNLDKVGFRFTSNQLFWLTAGAFGGHAAGVLQLHGAHLRRAPLDGDLHAESAAAGRGHGHRAAGQQHQLQHAAGSPTKRRR